MIVGLVIHTNGTTEDLREVNGNILRKAVGGWLQMIHLDDGNHMYINEEGKMRGLMSNPAATFLARDVLFRGDFIVGDAVIVGPVQGDDHLPIPADDEVRYRNVAEMHYM